MADHARRRSLLTAALGFALLRKRDWSAPPETQMVRRWLDTWRGVGDVAWTQRQCETMTWLLILGALAILPSIAAGHDRPDLRRTLDYIAANIEPAARFESNECAIKMVDVRSIERNAVRFSLSHVDLSRGDADTPGVRTAPSEMAIYLPREHVTREDGAMWETDQVSLQTPNKRLARAFSHAAKICGAQANK